MNYVNDIKGEINRNELLNILKIKKDEEKNIASNLEKIIKEESEEGLTLSKIEALWTYRKVTDVSDKGITIEGEICLSEKTFKNYMSEISHIFIALITIGPAIEERCAELQSKGEYTRALVLDAVGSSVVEDGAGKLNHIIAGKNSSEEISYSKRFSPGYGSFALSEQKKISDILPFEKLGVKLTDSFMMMPQKSITFCIYAGRVKEKTPDSCEICRQKDCNYRK